MASKHRKPSKKQVAGALAFAGEWALAYAVAKRLANAVADADADAFANIQELRTRVEHLEHEHGVAWSAIDEGYRPVSAILDQGRHHSITPENGLLAPSIVG